MGFKRFTAFTLVEVLITLLVLGIVAAITITVIIAKVQDLEYAAQLKNVYSTFASATVSARGDNGGTMIGYWPDHSTIHNNSKFSFGHLYSQYIKGTACKSEPDPATATQCWHKNGAAYNQDGTPVSVWCYGCSTFVSNSGFWAMAYGSEFYSCEGSIVNGPSNVCLSIYVDINGAAKPNRINYDIYTLYITQTGVGYQKNGKEFTLLNN